MTLLEGLVIGAIYSAPFVLAAVAAAAVIRLIGANRVARWLRLPPGDYE